MSVLFLSSIYYPAKCSLKNVVLASPTHTSSTWQYLSAERENIALSETKPAVFIRFGAAKSHRLLCSNVGQYLSGQPGKRERCFKVKQKTRLLAWFNDIIQQCSIFPGRRQPSIFDDEKLNFCVRDENRWDLLSIATGYGMVTNLKV